MRSIKTYRKVGAFYIAWEEDLSIPKASNSHLLQFCVFCFGFLQNRSVRVGIFPQCEEVLVSGAWCQVATVPNFVPTLVQNW
jgi:hypothetical protein